MVSKREQSNRDLYLWSRALRAPFLAASAVPVLVGTSAALYETGKFIPGYFLLNLLGVLALHGAANVANDYYDYLGGADPHHPPYPFHGGSQLIQDGILTPEQTRHLFLSLLILATLCGTLLALLRGPLVLLPGIAGTFCGYFYSAPPLRFAYRGWGEFTTGITFGPLAVMGTYLVQAGQFSLPALAASLPLGFLITAVLYVNQFPDVSADRSAGKKNLVVRLGSRAARPGLFFLYAAAYLSLLSGTRQGLLPQLTLLALLTTPLAGISLWYIYQYYDQPQRLVAASAAVVAAHTGSGLLLSLGYILSLGKGIG